MSLTVVEPTPRILVADDDQDLRHLVRDILEEEQMSVLCAANGSAALELFETAEPDVVVLDIDASKHRISLGMKQCEENPWAQYASKVNAGDIIEGEIRNITDFGLFVGLDGEIDGLVHHSDLSWDEPGDVAIKKYKRGERIKAKILSNTVPCWLPDFGACTTKRRNL